MSANNLKRYLSKLYLLQTVLQFFRGSFCKIEYHFRFSEDHFITSQFFLFYIFICRSFILVSSTSSVSTTDLNNYALSRGYNVKGLNLSGQFSSSSDSGKYYEK